MRRTQKAEDRERRAEVKTIVHKPSMQASIAAIYEQDDDSNDEDPSTAKNDVIYERPDGGWGWLVVVGTSLCFMLVGMQGPCFGIFYADRLQELGSSPSLPAWLFNFQAFCYNLVGAGGGICMNCCFQMNSDYFDKRIGLASGIMMAGGSLGLILLSQLASYLQQIYPFEWANIIAGMIMMNAIPAAMLLHPVEWHLKKTKSCYIDDAFGTTTSKVPSEINVSPDKESLRPLYSNSRIDLGLKMNYPKGISRGVSVPHELLNHNKQHNRLSLLHSMTRIRTLSESPAEDGLNRNNSSRNFNETGTPRGSRVALFYLGGSTIMGSVLTLQQFPIEGVITEEPDEDEESPVKVSSKEGFSKKFRCPNTDFLKDPLLMGVALFTSITIPTAMNIFGIVPFAMRDAGYSVQSAAFAVSVHAVVDLFTRLLCAFISNQDGVHPRSIYGFGQFILMCVPLGFIAGWNYNWVVFLCMGILGVGIGIIYALDLYLMAHLNGIEKVPLVFSTSQFFRAIGFLTLGPVGGVLRDVTGNYTCTFVFFIGAVALAFMIMLSTVFYTHRQSQQDANTT
ncbi:monocarboxylate transporter 4-like isoform X2 [Palaemon carinicauda]|uniref:monocarboxylate transporter 4-like isoform X2 n=1 Tax=Palaemon carinicauda TaxID=392227 RepID=UPI0035B691DF